MTAEPTQRWLIQAGCAFTLMVMAVLAMLLAYSGVRVVTRKDPGPSRSEGLPEQEAERLHRLSIELVELTAEYLDRRNLSDADAGSLASWVAESFAPQVNDLRRRILGATIPEQAMSSLLGAVDRIAAMAAQPQRGDLREAATSAVLDATVTVETYLSTGEAPSPALAPLHIPDSLQDGSWPVNDPLPEG